MDPEQSSAGLYCRLTVSQEADEPVAVLVACILNHWSHKGSVKRLPSRLPHWRLNHNSAPELGCFKNLH